MINFKNSLKKALTAAFGVVTMLSPLQGCQLVNAYTYKDIARLNDIDVETLSDLEIAVLENEATLLNNEIANLEERGLSEIVDKIEMLFEAAEAKLEAMSMLYGD